MTDPTGNRRFWPVRCTKIDMPKLIRKRDQLWAEAVVRYRSGEQWWLNEEEVERAGDEQADRMAIDPWVEFLEGKLNPGFVYTSVDILTEQLKVPIDRVDGFMKNRLADVLVALGWKNQPRKRRDETGKRVSVREWRRPE